MPSFTRTYTDDYATKMAPAVLDKAKEIEGHRKAQEALAALGADQDEDGNYLMDSVAAKEQLGIVFDMFVWQIYRRYDSSEAAKAAAEESRDTTESEFEHGGNA